MTVQSALALCKGAASEALETRHARELVRPLAMKAGIGRRVHPHMLRYTALTALYDKTRNLRMVQQVAGHTTSPTIERHTRGHPRAIGEAMRAIGDAGG